MISSLFKVLITLRNKVIRIIILDDSVPNGSQEFRVLPKLIAKRLFLANGLLFLVLLLTFMFTPLGGLLYNSQESEFNKNLVSVVNRIEALQDSLEVTEQQLNEMQSIIRLSTDTSLVLNERLQSLRLYQENRMNSELIEASNRDILSISTTGILSSSVLNELPVFPTSYPVKGLISRSFEPDLDHFGLDIAAREGAYVQAIEDGTVVNINWTLTNGYVLFIQHKGGYLSVYKHCRSITKEIGEVVVKGDVIATVGNAGTQTTASHLHVELWKDGHPQNPELYFLK